MLQCPRMRDLGIAGVAELVPLVKLDPWGFRCDGHPGPPFDHDHWQESWQVSLSQSGITELSLCPWGYSCVEIATLTNPWTLRRVFAQYNKTIAAWLDGESTDLPLPPVHDASPEDFREFTCELPGGFALLLDEQPF